MIAYDMTEEYESEQSYLPGQDDEGGVNLFTILPLAVILVSAAMFLILTSLASVPGSTSNSLQVFESLAKEVVQPEQVAQETTERSILAPLFTKEVHYWAPQIAGWADEWNLDPNLVATIMQIESCGDPQALSRAGAAGLFQVMPYHFKDGEDSFHPDTNAKRGLAYLSASLKDKENNVRLAIAGYNGGINGARHPEAEWPTETQGYVYWAMGIYEDAVEGEQTSDRLDEWLGRGGASLCRQAAERLGLTP